MNMRPSNESKDTLLPENEEFAKWVNQLAQLEHDQPFYEWPECLHAAVLLNITFANQNIQNPMVTTPLSWLLGNNPNKKLYRHGIKGLLQNPDLLLSPLCELDLYSIPIIYGDAELVKEMQIHGVPFDEGHIIHVLEFMKDPTVSFDKEKAILALKQFLSNSCELRKNSEWIGPLLHALQIKGGENCVELIVREFRIDLLKKLLHSKDPKRILNDIQESLPFECEIYEIKLEGAISDYVKEKIIKYIEPWLEKPLNHGCSVSDLPDSPCKTLLTEAGYSSLIEEKNAKTPLQHAVDKQDRELLQALLLFDGVRTQEIKSHAAIKQAASAGHFNLVHLLVNQITYQNLTEIADYVFDHKHYRNLNDMAGIVRVISLLKNASHWVNLKHITQALIKAHQQSATTLTAILMRDLHHYVPIVLNKFQSTVDKELINHRDAWKDLYMKFSQKYLFGTETMPKVILQFFTKWSLQTLEKADMTVPRDELRELAFYYYSNNKPNECANLLTEIAKHHQGKRTYEEAQLAVHCHFRMAHDDTSQNKPFLEVIHYLNALFNLLGSNSNGLFVIYSQYEEIYFFILKKLEHKYYLENLPQFLIDELSKIAETLTWYSNNLTLDWVKYILLRTAYALLCKMNPLNDKNKKLKGLSLLGSGIAMTQFLQPDLETACEQLKESQILFLELMQQNPVELDVFIKYADATRAFADNYMKLKTPRENEAKSIMENGIQTLKTKLTTLELKEPVKSEAEKALGYLILSKAYQITLNKDITEAQGLGEEGLRLVQKSLLNGTELSKLDYARHHFQVAILYRETLDEIEKAIEHLRTGLNVLLNIRPKSSDRTTDEKQTIYLLRSTLCYKLYFLANKINRELNQLQRGKKIIDEILAIVEDIRRDNHGKLNREEMVVIIRSYQQTLIHAPHSLTAFENLDNYLKEVYEELKTSDYYLQEYALSCLHLGHNLSMRGLYSEAEAYFNKSIEHNPGLKLIDNPHQPLSSDNELALLYLADTYCHLVQNMGCNVCSQQDVLLRAEALLQQAKKCEQLITHDDLTPDQIIVKIKITNGLDDIKYILETQHEIKVALEIKSKQSNKPSASPSQKRVLEKTKTEKPKKCKHVTPPKAEEKPDPTIEMLRLQNQYHSKRERALKLLIQANEKKKIEDDFPFLKMDETNPEPIRQKITMLDQILHKIFTTEPPVKNSSPQPKKSLPEAPKTPPKKKKKKKNKNKKKAEAIARKHEILKKDLAQEQKKNESSPIKKPEPSPDALRQKTLEKLREQEAAAFLKKQECEKQSKEKEEQEKEILLKEAQRKEKETLQEQKQSQNEQRLQDAKYTKQMERFAQQLRDEAEAERLKKKKPTDSSNSPLFGQRDLSHLLGLSLFRTPPLSASTQPFNQAPDNKPR